MLDHFFRPLFHVAVAVIIVNGSLATAQDSKQKLLRWSDVQTKQSIRAYFDGLENGVVTLKTNSGETYSIAVDRLSSANQRFIRNLETNGNDQADSQNDKDQPPAVPNNNDRINQAGQQAAQPIERIPDVTQKMYGIRWQPMDKLLTNQPIADAENKPVFWFRVLGDLEGLM